MNRRGKALVTGRVRCRPVEIPVPGTNLGKPNALETHHAKAFFQAAVKITAGNAKQKMP
jgi:hypothetical protein